MNNKLRKQYLLLAGRPILSHTLLQFDACNPVDKIFLVVPEEDFRFCINNILSPLNLQKKVKLIPGGKERQDSVYNGLLEIDNKSTSYVVIHDGVRPFIRPELISLCLEGARESGACIPGVPAYDTLKRVGSGYIKKTLIRDDVWLVQTPQVFKYDIIKKAYENARRKGYKGTDDAMLVEQMGQKIKIIIGNKNNIKITTKQDLLHAQALLQHT